MPPQLEKGVLAARVRFVEQEPRSLAIRAYVVVFT